MAIPSAQEIRDFYSRYFETWNNHNREGFIQNWRNLVNDVSAEDPVGTPLRKGFDQIVIGPWDLMNPTIICGSEAAMVVRNEITADDQVVVLRSIETMRYFEDGSVLLRNWWEPQGEMLESFASGDAN